MRSDDAAGVFAGIYAHNTWGDAESRSGGGSAMCATASVRPALPGLLRDLRIRSVLDAPCGDVNWMQSLLPQIHEYVGLDIVGPLVEANQARFGSASARSLQGDVSRDPPPPADLILVRDCPGAPADADRARRLAQRRAHEGVLPADDDVS